VGHLSQKWRERGANFLKHERINIAEKSSTYGERKYTDIHS
jgi:hypothetical protein